jgi:hypothetical protein
VKVGRMRQGKIGNEGMEKEVVELVRKWEIERGSEVRLMGRNERENAKLERALISSNH